MWRLSLKNVWSRKGRLLLTALAVIAGTAFLSGVFVFTDTMQSSFDSMFADAFKDTDAYVRSSKVIEGEFGEDQRDRIDESLVDVVKAVPGVTQVDPLVQALAAITVKGKVLGSDGPPKFGMSWSTSTASPFTLAEGTAPSAGSVVIDRGSAKDGDVKVGDSVTVVTVRGVRNFTVSGIATFAGNDSSLGATWALFDLATAQEFLSGQPGKVDGITVRGDGSASQAELSARITTALANPALEVKTGAQITKENQDSVAQVLNIITIAFSVFALISLFVGSFIIYNVFSISAAQRTQENALLRAIGASRRQVTRSMFTEALVVGIGGSLLGCLGGLGLAALILSILQRIGWLANETSLSIQPTGFLITVVVGVLVTVVCAIAPALRAGRVPPLAAMRDVSTDRSDISRTRLIGGIATVVAAVVAVILGLGGSTTWLGLGAGLMFLSIIVVGPLMAGPSARAVTPLLTKLRPVAGTIAGRNAARSPKRTALTAGALAIVVALFVGVATLGSSAKATTRDLVGKTFASDYTISGVQQGLPLPADLTAELNDSGRFVAMGFAGFPVEVDGKRRSVTVVEGGPATQIMRVPFVAGSFEALDKNSMIITTDEAADRGLAVGSTVTVVLKDGSSHPLKIVGVMDSKLMGRRVVDRTLFDGTGTEIVTGGIMIKTVGQQPRSALEAIVDKYPTAKLESRQEFINTQSKQIDGFLNLIYGLLGMSLFIAVIGIVITLLLAVYERRRELGLVRAVGMTRRQVRSSVLWESMITALIGTVLGVVLGIFLGWIIVQALKDSGLNVFALPVSTIVGTVVGALVLAAVASFLPARRAAKADILQAIATT